MRSNKVEFSTAAGPYCTIHDVKVSFCMPEFSSSKIIEHRFRVDNDKGELGIGYDMVIIHDLMVQLGLLADFKHQALQWDGITVLVKEPRVLQGQSDLTSHEMCKVLIQTAEPVSTIEATERLVKIFDSTYEKSDLKQVADNATQLNTEEKTQLLRLLKYFEDLFDDTLGDWDTEPIDLELKPYSKPFNCKYYLVPRINKEIVQNKINNW